MIFYYHEDRNKGLYHKFLVNPTATLVENHFYSATCKDEAQSSVLLARCSFFTRKCCKVCVLDSIETYTHIETLSHSSVCTSHLMY